MKIGAVIVLGLIFNCSASATWMAREVIDSFNGDRWRIVWQQDVLDSYGFSYRPTTRPNLITPAVIIRDGKPTVKFLGGIAIGGVEWKFDSGVVHQKRVSLPTLPTVTNTVDAAANVAMAMKLGEALINSEIILDEEESKAFVDSALKAKTLSVRILDASGNQAAYSTTGTTSLKRFAKAYESAINGKDLRQIDMASPALGNFPARWIR